MWVWSGSSWKKYFYSSGRGSKVTGWCAEDNVNEITPATVKNGDGFFFRRASSADGNITISGAIKATSSDPVALAKDNLHLICNPWPVEIAIKDVESMIDVPKGAAKLGDNADQIWKWDTAGKKWVRYFYSSGRGSKVTGWCAEDNVVEITTDKIGVGQGFFFRRASSADGTLTFVKPAGL